MNNDIKCVVCNEWLYNHTDEDAMNCLVNMSKSSFKESKRLDDKLDFMKKYLS